MSIKAVSLLVIGIFFIATVEDFAKSPMKNLFLSKPDYFTWIAKVWINTVIILIMYHSPSWE